MVSQNFSNTIEGRVDLVLTGPKGRFWREAVIGKLVTGMIPCPLTTFIMTYAIVHGAVGAGLVLSGTFAAGMIVTVAVFPLLAVVLRTRAWLVAPTHRLRYAAIGQAAGPRCRLGRTVR